MNLKRQTLVILLLLGTLTSLCKGERILVLGLVSSASHKITYMPLVEELGRRGHQITTLTGIKCFKQTPNVTEIFTSAEWERQSSMFNIFELKEAQQIRNSFWMVDFFEKICSAAYDQPQVMKILNEKFDLVILQSLFNECAAGIVYKLGAPLILFSPTSVPDFTIAKTGGYLPSSFVPHFFAQFGDEMTFYERFQNFWISVENDFIRKFYFEPRMTALYRKKLGDENIPSSSEIFANASMILSNGHFIFSKPRPHFPDVVDVGGIHSQPAKPLPKELDEFVRKSGKEGFIYFSMGSVIKAHTMPESKRKLFLKVFSKLRQQVLWKWEATMADVPDNVHLSKWLPQQNILGHSNIKLFITHCGLGGTEEAIYHGVPMLGLPIFADQPSNARQSRRLGILLELDWNTLTEDILYNGIQEVLNNTKYRTSVKKLSTIFKDSPDRPLDRGVFWVEYVLRHKGAPHLRSIARNLNMFQYHSLDVIALSFAIFSVGIYILYAIMHFGYGKIQQQNFSTRSIHKKIE